MIHSIIHLASIFLILTSVLQDGNRDATLLLAEELLAWEDANPIHMDEANVLNDLVTQAIQVEINQTYESNNELRNVIFDKLYVHSADMIEDSYDLRRHNWRRSVLFLNLALISKPVRKSVFVEYSKHSLFMSENEDELTNQLLPYLGILLVELVYLNDSGYETQLKEQVSLLRELLITHQDSIEKRTANDVLAIIEKY